MSRGVERRALNGFVRRVKFEFEYDSLHSLHDQVHPSTRSNNASECDVTFELYCTRHICHCHTVICTHKPECKYKNTLIE